MIKNFTKPSATIIYNAVIQPNTPLVLTSELDIASIFSTLNTSRNTDFTFKIRNLSGIELVAWPSGITRVPIEIDHSQIEFFMNGKPLSDYPCLADMMNSFLNSNVSNNNSFFSAFSEISFNSQNQYSSQPICPYIFAYANLYIMTLSGQTETNHLKLRLSYPNETTTISSCIRNLRLQGYGYNLDETILNPLVFESVQSLTITGSISSIQSDLFKYFEQLSVISFFSDDLKSFFRRVGIDWTTSLNTEFNQRFMVEFYDQNASNQYMYPDEDFCLFSKFPTKKNILPLLNFVYLANCTSTIRWILTYYFSHNMVSVFDQYDDANNLYSECKSAWKQTLNKDPTYFEQKVRTECHLTKTTTPSRKNECSLSKFCTHSGWCENFTSLLELNSILTGVSSFCNN
jgi:hypothetical protein